MEISGMWLIRSLCALVLFCPGSLFADVNVNDEGTWKAASEIHVNEGGAWKAVQEAHVNDAGVWKIVFTVSTPTEGNMTFEWEVTDLTNITEYKMYLNDTVLYTVTSPASVYARFYGPETLPNPARFYMTAMDSIAGETLPSNILWAAGYPDWQAVTAYALDDKINAGDNWAYSAPMRVISAGTSGSTDPTWPVGKYISGSVINLGNGRVNIPCLSHGFASGNDVTITGTTNYDGTYTLGAQADTDVITLTETYVVEDVTGRAVDKKVTDGSVVWELTYE